MLTTLILSTLLHVQDQPGPGHPSRIPWIFVEGADGLEAYEPLRPGPTAIALISRSELVARPMPTRRGLGVALVPLDNHVEVESVEIRVVQHRSGETVLVDADGVVWLVGEPEIPTRTRPRPQDLALLSRRDGFSTGGRLRLELDAPEPDKGCVLISSYVEHEPIPVEFVAGGAAEPSVLTLPPGPGRGLVIPASGAALELRVPAYSLDQVLATKVSRVQVDSLERLSVLAERGRVEEQPSMNRPAQAGYRSSWSWPEGRTRTEVPLQLERDEGVLFWVDPEPLGEEGLARTLLLSLKTEFEQRPPASSSPIGDPSGSMTAVLTDATHSAGLTHVHLEGPDEQLDIRPTMGPGAAWGDVDGDGWPDLYLVQGGGRGGCDTLPDRLFKNLGDGTFEDITREAGIVETGAGMGALFFDGDGDGDLDLYVANYGADSMYENLGSGEFREVGERLPRLPELWSAGVCAGDIDGDGDLDLYVTSYLEYDLEKMPDARDLGRYQREDPLPMLPFAFPGQRNVLLRNEGGLRFSDVTEEAGVLDAQGRGMQALFWDFDRDGDLDLYVANDVSPNVLFRNDGTGVFTDVSFSTGLDDPRGGMGLALGDADGDGDEDLFLTNWELEANALYLSSLVDRRASKHRRSTFRDGTVRAGLGPYGVGFTSWGAEFFDHDCDGDLDLFVANGYTSPDYEGTGICIGQPNHLFDNDGRGRFEQIGGGTWASSPSTTMTHSFPPRQPSRSVVGCDYDRDGDVDLLVTANNSRVQLLQNQQGAGPGRTFLGLQLRQPGRNPHGIGAVVRVRAGDREWIRSLGAGTSYLGGNPPELHFGLGDSKGTAEVSVTWPDGVTTEHTAVIGKWQQLQREG